jgi:hypothetical protein
LPTGKQFGQVGKGFFVGFFLFHFQQHIFDVGKSLVKNFKWIYHCEHIFYMIFKYAANVR